MAYSDFKLSEIIQKFELTLNEVSGLFGDVREEESSDLLTTILKENVDLAEADIDAGDEDQKEVDESLALAL
jgi:flagellar basal body L-ring protein FlgH